MNDFKDYYVTFSCDDKRVVEAVFNFAVNECGDEIGYSLRTNMNVKEPRKGKSFSAVLAALKQGFAARLPFWDKAMSIRAYAPKDGDTLTHPCLLMCSDHGVMPYEPQALALFSEDWEIFE